MEFMNYGQACALAERIKQVAPHVTVNSVFPASELEFNRNQYPDDAFLVSATYQGIDFTDTTWFQSPEHWNSLGWHQTKD